MAEIPTEAIEAAAEAIMDAQNANDGEPERWEARNLARAALEAAAPLLAEAWGVAEREQISEQIRQANQNLLAAASEYYRLAYPEAAAEEKP